MSNINLTHLVLRLLILVTVLAEIVFVIVVLLVIIAIQVVVLQLLESESLTSEPVDGAGNELFLDVLAQLVVKLEALLDVGSGVVLLLRGGLGR